MEAISGPQAVWPLWRRILFRCCFIFFLVVTAPWSWLSGIPGFDWLNELIERATDWLVNGANSSFLHVREELVPLNGSGDTSYGWAALWTYCSLAIAGGIIWSVLDRRRKSYVQLNYWLCVLLRYFLALIALSYGIAKLFLTQMPFPKISELATPLGDFLPMRLSWMFIGYSAPYQFFSGLMECLAGVLLLWRRTATLGTLIAAGVFLNVAVLNLSYDIPVKIFSMEMVAVSLFLLANESRRLICFFILNRPAGTCSIYHFPLKQRWMRVSRIVLKSLFLILAIGMTTAQTLELHAGYNDASHEALPPALYDVTSFSRNGQAVSDSSRWINVALDGRHTGSFSGGDPNFSARYGRRYFSYEVDTATATISMSRPGEDSALILFQYRQPDSSRIALQGLYGANSLELLLTRSPHHFQLAEKQFHWLSERNR